jgi:hypothetical protein
VTVIIDIDHEAGDFSEWTGLSDPGSDLSVSGSAGLAGTANGMAVRINDTQSAYAIYTMGADDTSGILRIRFYLDPNGLTINSGSNHFIGALRSNTNIATFKIEWTTTDGFGFQAQLVGDSATLSTAYYPISDAEHYIEVQLVRATNSTSNDGTLDLWIDGVHMEQLVGDNYDMFPYFRQLRLGATSGVDATSSGTYYLDEIVVNNDGSEIGAVGGGGSETTMTADEGSFALNGQAQTFAITMPAEHGAFS